MTYTIGFLGKEEDCEHWTADLDRLAAPTHYGVIQCHGPTRAAAHLLRAEVLAGLEAPGLSERDINEALERWAKEGRHSRDTSTPCPYPGNTVAHYMHVQGWVARDLQLALCRADPHYRAEQLRYGNVTEEDL